MSALSTSWADVETDLPPTEVIKNPDGTKTVISYKFDEKHRRVKVIQKIQLVKVTETVNPAIASRKKWAKFGDEKDNKTVGPDPRTTQFGETLTLKLSSKKKVDEDASDKPEKKPTRKVQKLKCRLCGGDHFTSKCPFKDTLGADLKKEQEEKFAEAEAAESRGSSGLGGAHSYVPPHLRHRMNGQEPEHTKQERELTPTVRVTNLNTAMPDDLLRSICSRYGMVNRCTILKNRETGESRGIAFVEMDSISSAQRVIDNVNGRGLMNLIVNVDFARPRNDR